MQPEGRFTQSLYAEPDDLISVNLKDFGLDPKIIRGRLKDKWLKPYPYASVRENIDVVLVALVVVGLTIKQVHHRCLVLAVLLAETHQAHHLLVQEGEDRRALGVIPAVAQVARVVTAQT